MPISTGKSTVAGVCPASESSAGLQRLRRVSQEYGWLIVALMATVLLQAVVICRSAVIAKDGVGFLRIAEHLAENPLEALRTEVQHPGYPLLALAAGRALSLVSIGDPFRNSIAGAQLAAAASGPIVVALLWLIAGRVYDRRVANVSAVLCAAWPLLRLNASDTLSDSPHLMFYLAAAWLMCEGLVRSRAGWFAVAGTMSGLAYWVRPEGLSVCLVAGLFLIVALACRRLPMSAPRAILSLVLLATTSAAVVAPYVYFSGKLTKKKHFITSSTQPKAANLPTEFLQPTAGVLSEPAPGTPLPDDRPRPPTRVGAVLAGLAELGHELGEGFLYFLLVPLALGNLPLGTLTPLRTTRTDLPASFLCLLCVCHALLLLALYVSAGYISHRHVMPMVALMIPSTAAGVLVAADVLSRRATGAWRLAVGAPALTALLCLSLLPKYGRPLHQVYAPILAASQWLERHSRPDDAVLATSGYVRFYAHRQGLLLGPEVGNLSAGLARAPVEKGWRFIVLEVDDRAFDRHALADAGYRQVCELPGHARKSWNKILVFEAADPLAAHVANRRGSAVGSTQ